MARNKSYIKLEGTLDGLTFYEKDGQSFVRTKGGVNKNRIENDPAFKRTRENMQEFGGSANVGKALRSALGTVVKLMSDSYMAARLSGIMKRINSNGPGFRGQRSFEILANSDLLKGFELNKKDPLSTQFFAPYSAPSLNANRDVITWLVPDFDTDSFISAPEGATHCRLVLAAGLLSDYTFETALNSYEPVNEDENAIGSAEFSRDIPLKGMTGGDTTLVVDLGIGAAVAPTTATVAAIGIVFYQEINGALYELAQGNAMKIATVG